MDSARRTKAIGPQTSELRVHSNATTRHAGPGENEAILNEIPRERRGRGQPNSPDSYPACVAGALALAVARLLCTSPWRFKGGGSSSQGEHSH